MSEVAPPSNATISGGASDEPLDAPSKLKNSFSEKKLIACKELKGSTHTDCLEQVHTALASSEAFSREALSHPGLFRGT